MPRTLNSDRRSTGSSALADAMFPSAPDAVLPIALGCIFFNAIRRVVEPRTPRPPAAEPARRRLVNALTKTAAPTTGRERAFEALAALGHPVDQTRPTADFDAIDAANKAARKEHANRQRRANGAKGGAKSKTGNLHAEISDIADRLRRSEPGLSERKACRLAASELHQGAPQRFSGIVPIRDPNRANRLKAIGERVRKWRESRRS